MKVGFVGLGVMGRPMAGHLIAAGHEVAVWARRPESAAPLAAAGARVHATPAELARHCEVVISVVTASADVEHLALGPDGLINGLAAGAIHVDMSTIAPETARKVAARYAEMGIGWLDAPVSGGEVGARDATLAIMAGGDAAVLERVRPLFACLGKTVVHIGPAGAGQVAKACNQMIMVNAIQACAEAMRLADAHGVDLHKVREALMGGSAASRVLDVMGGRMARRDFAAGIQSRLHHKDFAILMEEARQLGAPLPVAAQTWQQLNALMAMGGGRDDTASLLRVLEPVQCKGA
ncbi:NAD(P)-dependent oxidoreductase [Zoogloea sp.]|uniref:NAD(P)-dependent oxidoreductase n=1 Tax=Zoogloea sp. TaxID=49181 RepID=UPI001B745393|nr:NAD(P)-dependent oxidoreductase [Zoogloea sp.]MBK6652894.1 NAD(P)-dependent oxidoreductase [Zoogloea sp.]MBK7848355.1 NAD(P)-dependent oxidoreductase [Zoogloea sp.]MBP7446619.1 NAD(P)-dependent oxidoreductase [Zoogloea sp.]